MMWIKASGTWLADALEENLIILSDMLLDKHRLEDLEFFMDFQNAD